MPEEGAAGSHHPAAHQKLLLFIQPSALEAPFVFHLFIKNIQESTALTRPSCFLFFFEGGTTQNQKDLFFVLSCWVSNKETHDNVEEDKVAVRPHLRANGTFYVFRSRCLERPAVNNQRLLCVCVCVYAARRSCGLFQRVMTQDAVYPKLWPTTCWWKWRCLNACWHEIRATDSI